MSESRTTSPGLFSCERYAALLPAPPGGNSVSVVAANAPANNDLTGSHGQSRIIARDGNILKEASTFGEDILISTLNLTTKPELPLEGLLADWWRSGIEWMMKDRHQQLK